MSLQEKDQAAAAVAVAPRVSLADIEAKIASKHFTNGRELLGTEWTDADVRAAELLTICLAITTSGFTVIGKSACVSPENFNAELGQRIAYDDCLNQLWALEGYLLRDKLSRNVEADELKQKLADAEAKLPSA